MASQLHNAPLSQDRVAVIHEVNDIIYTGVIRPSIVPISVVIGRAAGKDFRFNMQVTTL